VSERFDAVVEEWRRYQESPMGRLRTELFWRGLQRHLPSRACDVVDLGGGSGELAEAMAGAGHRVTLVDASQAMLDAARARPGHASVSLLCADVTARHALPIAPGSLDVVACHSVIEFVDDPVAVLQRSWGWLRPGGVISLGMGNLRHATLQAAVVHGDLARAARELCEVPDAINRLGMRVRMVEPDIAVAWLRASGFEPLAEYGIRCVADLLAKELVNDATYDDLLTLETHMLPMPAYARIGRFIQLIARKPC
jgi:S-adenosylmethionine-dependent methyltransferase